MRTRIESAAQRCYRAALPFVGAAGFSDYGCLSHRYFSEFFSRGTIVDGALQACKCSKDD